MLSMEDIQELFDIAEKEDFKYLFISILLPNSTTPEVIINKKENFESKKDYYLKNYKDGLEYPELKANSDVKIIDCGLLSGDFEFLFNPMEDCGDE